jgi:hypothetical protein
VSSSYLHIAYLPQSAGWLLPVITAVKSAASAGLRDRASAWGQSPLCELGFAVSTKLAILPEVIRLVDKLLQDLGREVAQLSNLDEHVEKQAGFVPNDKDLPYKILAAVDLFVYESRSTYEIVGKFVRSFSKEILETHLDEEQVKAVLRTSGIEDSWIADLADQRKLFFHDTAPWIALKIFSRTPLKTDLLILKRDVCDLGESPDVISFNRLKAIHDGLLLAMGALQAWLIKRVRDRDTALAIGASV